MLVCFVTHPTAPEETDLEQDETGHEQGRADVVEHLELLRFRADAMLHVKGGGVVEENVQEA